MSYIEIKKDIETADINIITSKKHQDILPVISNTQVPVLPQDSINLFDKEQQEFYRDNRIVLKCLELIKTRRLDTAINRSQSLYTTLTDRVHLNRLIIPFNDSNNKIVFYQSRTVLPDDERPKYLSKVNSERSIFGIERIDTKLEYIFITEGPIDAMFVKNGVALAGINESSSKNFTPLQKQQLRAFPLFQIIWVLDNQANDSASRTKTKKLLDLGEKVFIWPKSFSNYKDINEYCIDKNINGFDTDTILDNSYTGLRGKLLLSEN
jgi:hypothetical protein